MCFPALIVCLSVLHCLWQRGWKDTVFLFVLLLSLIVLGSIYASSIAQLKRILQRIDRGDVDQCVNCNFTLDLSEDTTRCPECGESYQCDELEGLWRQAMDTWFVDDWFGVGTTKKTWFQLLLGSSVPLFFFGLIEVMAPWCK